MLKLNEDFELFVFDGKLPSISSNMQKADEHFPPNSILSKGDEAVRAYWNRKNLRKRVKNEN